MNMEMNELRLLVLVVECIDRVTLDIVRKQGLMAQNHKNSSDYCCLMAQHHKHSSDCWVTFENRWVELRHILDCFRFDFDSKKLTIWLTFDAKHKPPISE